MLERVRARTQGQVTTDLAVRGAAGSEFASFWKHTVTYRPPFIALPICPADFLPTIDRYVTMMNHKNKERQRQFRARRKAEFARLKALAVSARPAGCRPCKPSCVSSGRSALKWKAEAQPD